MHISQNSNEVAIISVTNLLGEKIKEFNINTNQTAQINIDAPSGVYVLTIITTEGWRSEKIVIMSCC